MSPDAIRPVLSLSIVLLLAAALPWAVVVAAEPAGLSGAIKDSAGRLVDGVEVLVVPASASVRPLATALSDATGRFIVPELAPGIYRVAALKSGYTTWIGVVDTKLDRWVDVVLRPGKTAGKEKIQPIDATWGLRLPRRNVFRDTGADVAGLAPPVETAGATDRPVTMQVDHLLAVAGVPGTGGGPTDVHGSETRLRVSSALGDKGNIRVAGRHQSLDSAMDRSADAHATHSGASELNVDFSYATGEEERVDVSAWYGMRDFALQGPPGLGEPSHGQAQRSIGYHSSWRKELNQSSRVAVSMRYDQRTLDVERAIDPLVSARATPEFGEQGRFANRSVQVAGAYDSVAGEDHLVEATFSARRLETPAQLAFGDNEANWTLEADAQDRWRLSTPISAIYGLNYQQALGRTDAAVVAPRAGGRWDLEQITLRFTVSYHEVTHWEAEGRRGLAPGQPVGGRSKFVGDSEAPAPDVGYAGEVEFRLPRGLKLIGATSWSPLQLGAVDVVHGADVVDLPLYVSDGPAAVGDARVTLRHESGATHMFVEFSSGQIDGVLAPLQPYTLVAESFEPGSMQYTNGRWGVRVIPSGTDVRLEYRRVDGFASDSRVPIAEQRTLELKLSQDLMRFDELGNWRLLMAVRMGSVDRDGDDSTADEYIAAGTLGGGVSAGLSVTF